jgi:hypothetical protein
LIDYTQSKALLSANRSRAITIESSTMSQAPTRPFDQAVLSAWQAELKATGDATLTQQCLQREADLLPRFAAHYPQLKALRRRVRGSLQRQWKCSLAEAALLLTPSLGPALAATLDHRTRRSLDGSSLFHIPFNNLIPAFAILFICIGELELDGLMVFIAFG